MSKLPDSEGAGQRYDSKMVLLKFPKPLLQEADALSRFNCIDRTEFITFALSLLLDYMDRKIGVRASSGDNAPPEPGYDLEDDDVLEAAEHADD